MIEHRKIFTLSSLPPQPASPAAANGLPPVFVYDSTRARWSLRLRRGKWAGQEWTVTPSFCDNPLCACTEITLSCRRVGAAAAAPLTCVLDPIEMAYALGDVAGPHADSAELVRDMVAEFGAEDWRQLQQILIVGKRELLRDLDVATLPAESLPQALPADTSTALYADAFPFAAGFEFHWRDEHWLADDQYCVSPECGCQEVVLAFLPLTAPPDTTGDIPSDRSPLARYNYATDRIEPVQPPAADQPTLRELTDALRAENPAFLQDVRKRHRQLKAVYARALALAPPAARSPDTPRVPAEPKVGRNDPCPCGSGKKYKKCCGGPGRSAGSDGSGLGNAPRSRH